MMSRGGLLGSISRFDKASMKHTADLTNRKDPKTLSVLAAEAVAFYISKIKLNLNHDQLWIVYKVLSRGNKMEDLILKRMVEESESRFYDIEEYKINWNGKVTLKGLPYLLQLFPNMKRIDVTGCNFAEKEEGFECLFKHPSLVFIENRGAYFPNSKYLQDVCALHNWKAVFMKDRPQELDFIHKLENK